MNLAHELAEKYGFGTQQRAFLDAIDEAVERAANTDPEYIPDDVFLLLEQYLLSNKPAGDGFVTANEELFDLARHVWFACCQAKSSCIRALKSEPPRG